MGNRGKCNSGKEAQSRTKSEIPEIIRNKTVMISEIQEEDNFKRVKPIR